MQVISIETDWDGAVGVALDYRGAIDFLINKGYLYDTTEVCDARTGEWRRLDECLGEEWADEMRDKWTINDFNEYWEGSFYLITRDVYEGAR